LTISAVGGELPIAWWWIIQMANHLGENSPGGKTSFVSTQ